MFQSASTSGTFLAPSILGERPVKLQVQIVTVKQFYSETHRHCTAHVTFAWREATHYKSWLESPLAWPDCGYCDRYQRTAGSTHHTVKSKWPGKLHFTQNPQKIRSLNLLAVFVS